MRSRAPVFAIVRWTSLRLVIVVAVAIAWQGLIWYWKIPAYLLPDPLGVARAAAAAARSLLAHAAYTVGAAVLGILISTTSAVTLALLFTNSRNLATASMPLVIVFRSAPVTAIAPLIMLMVGRGIGTSVIVVTIVSFFPIFVNLTRGLAAPDPIAVELMMVTGASRWQQLRYLRLPAAMPFLLRACASREEARSSAPCFRNG